MTILRSSTRRQPLQVVVVGGGAAAVIAALHLFQRATPAAPVDVHLVERSPASGRAWPTGPTTPGTPSTTSPSASAPWTGTPGT
ncbi:FAD/NAD(P)-binding protein [Nocardioides houyundeii]|uniref:FAD/NAD(P)-binding protein n=1 Tax=Nocardioides houyundeii TaxID=2045452 RepID=UPI000C7599E6|nr:FAD/NAD(P)-binding protein [Nocardioides houyundeii]